LAAGRADETRALRSHLQRFCRQGAQWQEEQASDRAHDARLSRLRK
jgi:hypothetical protein